MYRFLTFRMLKSDEHRYSLQMWSCPQVYSEKDCFLYLRVSYLLRGSISLRETGMRSLNEWIPTQSRQSMRHHAHVVSFSWLSSSIIAMSLNVLCHWLKQRFYQVTAGIKHSLVLWSQVTLQDTHPLSSILHCIHGPFLLRQRATMLVFILLSQNTIKIV